jgi:hypothetical protein
LANGQDLNLSDFIGLCQRPLKILIHHTCLPAMLKELLHMYDMFLHVVAMDVGIIEVSDQMVHQFRLLVNVVIHKSLKEGRGIHETKCHDIELVWSIWHDESCQPLVTRFYA